MHRWLSVRGRQNIFMETCQYVRKVVHPYPKLIEGTDDCENINECDLNNDLCPEKSQYCSDTEGSYECLCDSGYEERNYDLACIDINECT